MNMAEIIEADPENAAIYGALSSLKRDGLLKFTARKPHSGRGADSHIVWRVWTETHTWDGLRKHEVQLLADVFTHARMSVYREIEAREKLLRGHGSGGSS